MPRSPMHSGNVDLFINPESWKQYVIAIPTKHKAWISEKLKHHDYTKSAINLSAVVTHYAVKRTFMTTVLRLEAGLALRTNSSHCLETRHCLSRLLNSAGRYLSTIIRR
jgi:hypothetical protein